MEKNEVVNDIFAIIRRWADENPEERSAFALLTEGNGNYFNTYGDPQDLVLHISYRMIKDVWFRNIIDKAVAKVNIFEMKEKLEDLKDEQAENNNV